MWYVRPVGMQLHALELENIREYENIGMYENIKNIGMWKLLVMPLFPFGSRAKCLQMMSTQVVQRRYLQEDKTRL